MERTTDYNELCTDQSAKYCAEDPDGSGPITGASPRGAAILGCVGVDQWDGCVATLLSYFGGSQEQSVFARPARRCAYVCVWGFHTAHFAVALASMGFILFVVGCATHCDMRVLAAVF